MQMTTGKRHIPYYIRNLIVLSSTVFISALSWTQVTPFLPLFIKEIGPNENVMAWSGLVYAAPSLASIIALPFWGRMGDKYGRKAMTARAGICLAGIYFAMSLCATPWQLVIARFMNGVLTGFIPGSIALIATNTPEEKAPRAVATIQSASAAGQIIGPAVGGLLAAIPFIGYRGTMRISGAAVLLCTILVYTLVIEKNKAADLEKSSLLDDFRIAFKSTIMASVMLAVFLSAILMSGLSPVLALYIGKLGGAPASKDGLALVTGIIFALPAVAFVLTAQLWTRLGERRGHHFSVYLGGLGAAAFCLILAFSHNIWLFGALFFLAGISVASFNPAAGAIICTQIDEAFRGRAYGMLWSAMTLGGLIAPLAASAIGDAWGIPSIFLFISMIYALGLVWFGSLVKRWSKTGGWQGLNTLDS